MTATCLNTNGIDAVLRICCCASGSIVFHGRKTTALSLTVSTTSKLAGVRQVGQGTPIRRAFGSDSVRASRYRLPPWRRVGLGLGRNLLGHHTGRRRCGPPARSEEHTSELQSQSNLVCRL